MGEGSTGWMKFSAERIAALPEVGAIFEIATLVRNVVFIGRAEGNLRTAAERILAIPGHLPVPSGGLYLRFRPTDDEGESLRAHLARFQAAHGGELPVANRHPWPARTAQPVAA